jgi:hypothetical protein
MVPPPSDGQSLAASWKRCLVGEARLSFLAHAVRQPLTELTGLVDQSRPTRATPMREAEAEAG